VTHLKDAEGESILSLGLTHSLRTLGVLPFR